MQPTNRPGWKEKLEGIIEKGLEAGAAQFRRIAETRPVDSIVNAASQSLAVVAEPSKPIRLEVAGQRWNLHSNALQQVSEKMGIPRAYVNDLSNGVDWQRELLAEIFGRSFRNLGGRYLVRSVEGEARAFLSDKYRRLDTAELLTTFGETANAYGAKPFAVGSSDLRVAVKALIPEPVEIAPDEWVAVGVEWGHSDYGLGANELRQFFLRLACINGAVATQLMRQVHIGARLPENFAFAEDTFRADTRASRLAMRDVVRGVLSREGTERAIATVRKSAEKELSWEAVRRALGDSVTKKEAEGIENAFKSPDVLNLPAGNTAWRASNAVSWFAKTVENTDRVIELERAAGRLVVGSSA